MSRQTLFLVQRCGLYTSGRPRRDVDRPNFSPRVPLRLFGDRAAAEAYRDEILLRLRQTLSPFSLGEMHHLTSLSDKALVNGLWALGIHPPHPGPGGSERDPIDWPQWWAETLPGLSFEQVEGVWALLDRLRLVEVVELPLDRRR